MPLTDPSDISKLYHADLDKMLQLENATKSLISNLVAAKGIKVHLIESRTKSLEGLITKCVRKNKYESLIEITDIVGIRVVTLFEKEVDVIARIIEDEFKLDADNSIDKRKSIDPDRFGYLSLHYICKINDSRRVLSEYSHLPEFSFEIQIRSILQHAWAAIEHSIGYKNDLGIPRDIRRVFSQAASLLEVSDKYFNEIDQEYKSYLSATEEKFRINDLDIPIDSVTLERFIQSDYIRNIEQDILRMSGLKSGNTQFSPPILTIKSAGFSSIEEIIVFCEANRKEIYRYFERFTSKIKAENDQVRLLAGFSIIGICNVKMKLDGKEVTGYSGLKPGESPSDYSKSISAAVQYALSTDA